MGTHTGKGINFGLVTHLGFISNVGWKKWYLVLSISWCCCALITLSQCLAATMSGTVTITGWLVLLRCLDTCPCIKHTWLTPWMKVITSYQQNNQGWKKMELHCVLPSIYIMPTHPHEEKGWWNFETHSYFLAQATKSTKYLAFHEEAEWFKMHKCVILVETCVKLLILITYLVNQLLNSYFSFYIRLI